MSNYNLASVIDMAGGDDDFVKVVVQTFLEEIPPDLQAMNEALTENNPGLSYQYAHKMKPNLQMFGLELMPQIKTIEEWAKSSKPKAEVEAAAAIITGKVKIAIEELRHDFDLE